jgi:glycerol-3-phosphate dehydrogenase
MAEEIVDEASKVADLPEVSCKTHHFSIHGNIPASHADQSDHLYIYGSDIPEIKKLQQSDAALKQKIHPKYDATYAEVLWAIECEMAETLEDVLAEESVSCLRMPVQPLILQKMLPNLWRRD